MRGDGLEATRRELRMVIAAERELDAALHSAIGELAAAQRGARGGGLVEELMATAPTELAKLELSTRALADRVGMQRVFAEEVSGAVRAMDVQKARLELALKCVDDIIELTKGSAAHEVNTQQIDWAGGEVLELSLRKAIKAQDEAEVARLVKLAAPLGEKIAARALRLHSEHLAATIRAHADALLAEVGEASGAGTAAQSLEGYRIQQALSSLLNFVAQTLQRNLPLVASPEWEAFAGPATLLTKMYDVCDARVAELLVRYVAARDLDALAEETEHAAAEAEETDDADDLVDADGLGGGGGGGGVAFASGRGAAAAAADGDAEEAEIRALVRVLNELAVILQHFQSYDRFVSSLAREVPMLDAAELVARSAAAAQSNTLATLYVRLEHGFMRRCVAKAWRREETTPALDGEAGGEGGGGESGGGGGARSAADEDAALTRMATTVVEDVSFIVLECGQRAAASGRADVVCAVVNHMNGALRDDMLEEFSRRAATLVGLEVERSASGNSLSALHRRVTSRFQTAGLGKLARGLSNATTAIEAASAAATDALAGIDDFGGEEGGGGGADGGGDERVFTVVTLNNLQLGERYIALVRQRLVSELELVFGEGFARCEASFGEMLRSVLSELKETAAAFHRERRDAMVQLIDAMSVTSNLEGLFAAGRTRDAERADASSRSGSPRAKSARAHGSVLSYRLDDVAFAAVQSADPLRSVVVPQLHAMLRPFERNFVSLLERIIHCVTTCIERELMRGGRGSVTQLGGVQLDADRRSLASFFANLPFAGDTMVHVTRDRMTRLGRIASLLSVDSLRDAVELVAGWAHLEADSSAAPGGGGGSGRGKSRGAIAADDARVLLALRADLSETAIAEQI